MHQSTMSQRYAWLGQHPAWYLQRRKEKLKDGQVLLGNTNESMLCPFSFPLKALLVFVGKTARWTHQRVMLPAVMCGLVAHRKISILEDPVRFQCPVLFSSSKMPADHGLYILVSRRCSDTVILTHSATEANGRPSFILCVQRPHCSGKRCDYFRSHVVVSILIIKKEV